MTVLTDLPDDILLEILAYLEKSTRDLLQISRTCRRFVPIAKTHLYHTVHVLACFGPFVYPQGSTTNALISHSEYSWPDHLTVGLFRRSLNENALLGPLVKKLCISWSSERRSRAGQGSGLPFSALPNLKHLEIVDGKEALRFTDTTPSQLDHMAWVIAQCCHLPLQSYVLDVAGLSSTMLASVMVRPSVESVSAPRICDIGRGVGPCTTFKPELAAFVAAGVTAPSTLKYLDLGMYRISLPALEGILKFAPRLQHLKANVPGRGCRFNLPDYGMSENERFLNPSRIAQALRPVQDTLEELDMVNDRHSWKGTDATRADFSAFPKLRKMRVAPGLWFKWGAFGYGEHMNIDHGFVADNEDRRGLWQLLPPNLEELEIYFQFDAGIFCVSILHTAKLEAMIHMTPEHYHWIQELATYKAQNFPNLRSVRLIEQISTGPAFGQGISFEEMRRDAPVGLRDAYAEAGVELKLQLRSNHRRPAAEMKPCCTVASAYGRPCCTNAE